MSAELTARQVQVVTLVAEGLTNASIGRRLSISELTVKKHLCRISRKFDMPGDRAGIVAVAYRRRILPVPGVEQLEAENARLREQLAEQRQVSAVLDDYAARLL